MANKLQEFDDSATIPFGSITNSYADFMILPGNVDMVFIFNTTDAPILLNMPSGASGIRKNIRFPAYSSIAMDCRTNSKALAAGTIQIKYASGAPTLGEVTITVAR